MYAGDYNMDMRVSSRDEISELAGMFKKMMQRIREQIRIIEQKRDALKKAQAQNKVFFANAAHEMNPPLTTLIGYAQIIKKKDRVIRIPSETLSFFTKERLFLTTITPWLFVLYPRSRARAWKPAAAPGGCPFFPHGRLMLRR